MSYPPPPRIAQLGLTTEPVFYGINQTNYFSSQAIRREIDKIKFNQNTGIVFLFILVVLLIEAPIVDAYPVRFDFTSRLLIDKKLKLTGIFYQPTGIISDNFT